VVVLKEQILALPLTLIWLKELQFLLQTEEQLSVKAIYVISNGPTETNYHII